MRTALSFTSIGRLLPAVIALTVACGGGSSSPTAPTQTTPTTTTPAATAVLASVTIASASVAGGNQVQGTITLTAAAPAGGAVVTLTSSQSVATVPGSVTVAAGQTSATFPITTVTVTEARDATITASMSGVSRTATLSVTTVPLTSVFSVVSSSRGNDACALLDGGNTIDCTFNGSQSTGPIREWRWEYAVGSRSAVNTSSEATTRPQPGCGFFAGHQPSSSGATQFLQMEVTLIVSDARGNSSQPVKNSNIRVFPNRNCGYGF